MTVPQKIGVEVEPTDAVLSQSAKITRTRSRRLGSPLIQHFRAAGDDDAEVSGCCTVGASVDFQPTNSKYVNLFVLALRGRSNEGAFTPLLASSLKCLQIS